MEKKEEEYLPPIHPGEILELEFMKPLNLSQNTLGKALGVSPRRINEIVHGRRGITADTAIRLSRFFGTTAQFWLNLQTEYELDCVLYEEHTGKSKRFDFIKRFVPKTAAIL